MIPCLSVLFGRFIINVKLIFWSVLLLILFLWFFRLTWNNFFLLIFLNRFRWFSFNKILGRSQFYFLKLIVFIVINLSYFFLLFFHLFCLLTCYIFCFYVLWRLFFFLIRYHNLSSIIFKTYFFSNFLKLFVEVLWFFYFCIWNFFNDFRFFNFTFYLFFTQIIEIIFLHLLIYSLGIF